MRAAVIHAAHDLRLQDWPDTAPGVGEVLIRMKAGGICGSDLHYYHDGGFGQIRVREPIVPGHEIAGVIEAVGAGVSNVKPGDRVAVNPSLACGTCRFCKAGQQQHCLDMRFMGSAMRMPHVQGGFRERMTCEAVRAIKVEDHVTLAEAAFAEPLAVCLHAVKRAGDVKGKRVLITGSGPIGALTILAARAAGAAEITVTDVAAAPLAIATKVGADRVLNVAADPDSLKPFEAEKGSFDVLFEASGNERALAGALASIRPGGIIVQIGVAGQMTIPTGVLVAKELELRGTFRFHGEFQESVDLLNRRAIDVLPLLTATLPLEQAVEAFELASDRSRSVKVQLAL
jgi:L-idonate 5-dehydrogenase